MERFLDRCEQLAALHDEDADAGSLGDRTSSARLMAAWRVAQWSGLTSAQAVEAVMTYQPALARKAWNGSRKRSWALEDAQRVYARPMLGERERVHYDGSEGAQAVAGFIQRKSRLPEAWDYVVAQANHFQQTEMLGLGVEQLAAALGVTKMTASRWLEQLQELGLLECSAKARFHFDPSRRGDNRVRKWRVRGVEVLRESSGAAVLTLAA